MSRIVGHYQLGSLLGAGGMGEVFRAHDTKLGRDVAIKLLPPTFTDLNDRLDRFEQEARTLAALNHPNIMVIFDSGVQDGSPYLVSELLEGATLRDKLNEGPVPLRRAVEYATQIAHGLAAAHAKGVVHRDLKPENVFITDDGRVKILDFGLAKLQEYADSSGGTIPPSAKATIVQTPTEPGMILGSPGYMSPEQVRGEAATERSDIFAFGAILYEMLCGRRTFEGPSSIEVMHAIVNAEPPELCERVPNIPPAVERVVRRCLEKRPDQRFQTAVDLAFALENSISTSTSVLGREHIAASRRFDISRILPWAIAAIALGMSAYSMLLLRRAPVAANLEPRPAAPLRKIELTLPAITRGLTIAPDGRKLVYVDSNGLWLRWLDRVGPRVLLSDQSSVRILGGGIQRPFWSPQSTDVAYFAGAEIFRVPIGGGAPRSIATIDVPDSPSGVWLEDGRIVFATGASELFEVPASGGRPKSAMTKGNDDVSYHHVSALPGGRGILFSVFQRSGTTPRDTIAVWSPSNSRKDLLQIPGTNPAGSVYSPSGHVLYRRVETSSAVWAFPFSLETMERTGDPFLVVDNATEPSVSIDGTFAYALTSSARSAPRQLVWVDRSGTVAGAIGAAMPELGGPQLSADGNRITAVSGDNINARDVWVIDASTGSSVPVTRTPGPESDPFWFPDSSKVLYTAVGTSNEEWTVRTKPVSGFSNEEIISKGWIRAFSRSGRYVFVRAIGALIPGVAAESARLPFWCYIDLAPGSERRLQPFPTGLVATDVALSPDDRLMAYSSGETGQLEIFVVTFPDFANKVRISRQGGERMQWHPDGSELFWLSGRQLWSATVKRDAGAQLSEPAKLFDLPEGINLDGLDPTRTRFQVAPDGQKFLMVRNTTSRDGDADTRQQPANAMLVENWFEEFRDKR